MALKFTWPGGLGKALVMSYDDGCIQDRKLVGILNRYGIKGTFHVNSGMAESPSRLSLAELNTIYDGHEISCHTFSHPYLERIPHDEVMREVWLDRELLEKSIGRQVRGISYPMRNYTPEVINICRTAGIMYARRGESTGKFNLPADFMLWQPTCHHVEAMKYLENFRALEDYRKLSLFFVWGHSFEFDRENSGITWEMIDDFCCKVSQVPDVWFASCIEVCRYVNAMRAAEVSCDGSNIYNPTAETLYLVHEDKLYQIASGETLYF